MPVTFSDLESAFLFTEGDESAEAFLNTKTGETFIRSDFAGIDDLPEDLDESEDYVRLPDKRDLDLGVRLVMAFARDEIPEHYDEIDRIFSRKGAYRRFKDFLARIERLEAWYAYRDKATEKALREWCEVNEIEVEG